MCYSSERFRPVFSIIYFIYDSINCPTTVGGGVGGGWLRVEEKDSLRTSSGNWNLLPGKANYHWMNDNYPVIIMSTTHHARIMPLEAFVIAGLLTATLAMESCYKLVLTIVIFLYRSVDYEKRAWWLFDTIFMQYLLKEEQRQAVLGLLGQKDVVAVLPTGFGKSLITSCSRQWNSNKGKRIWY